MASPLGSNVPVYEPSDRLIYQATGRQLLRPDVHGLYVVSAIVTLNGTATTLYQSYIAGTYVGVATCTQCHGGGLAQAMVTPWSATAQASIFTGGINGVDGTATVRIASPATRLVMTLIRR
ncbi:MAG: hypothetical protein WDO73_31335 [Ignavibacteriota bacterium]